MAEHVLYLDQNAWIALNKGSWDKSKYPKEHAALQTGDGHLNAELLSKPT
jgi:hypothetical protein